jgi:hypothetical protein
MTRFLLVYTPKAGSVTITYSDNAGYDFNWSWIDLKDSEKADAVLWLRDEGFLDKLSGELLHDTPLEQCIVQDLIFSIREVEYK